MADAPSHIEIPIDHLARVAAHASEAGELLTDRHLLLDLPPHTRNRLHDIGRGLLIDGWRLQQLVGTNNED